MKKQKACHTIKQLVKYICCCLPSDSKINYNERRDLVSGYFCELSNNCYLFINRLKYMELPKVDGPRSLLNSCFTF